MCEGWEYVPLEKIGGVNFAARLLEMLDMASRQTILDSLACHEPELAGEIRRQILVFEDIARLADDNTQCLLRNIDRTILPVALKDASEALKDRFFTNMTKRAVAMLKEDIELLGPMEPSDIERAQREIINILRRLIHVGAFIISDDHPFERKTGEYYRKE